MPRNPVITFKPKNSQDVFEVDEVYVYDKPLGSGAYGARFRPKSTLCSGLSRKRKRAILGRWVPWAQLDPARGRRRRRLRGQEQEDG